MFGKLVFWGDAVDTREQTISADTQIRAVSQALDAVLASSSPTDLCKQIVHAGFASNLVRGCALFFLDNKSVIKPLVSYGKFVDVDSELSAWDDSILSEAVRERVVRTGKVTLDGHPYSLLAVPFIANGVPRGLVALVIENDSFGVNFTDEIWTLVSKLGAFYLQTLDLSNITSGRALAAIGPEDLTSRQLLILTHIGSGLVNLEIAKILLLSESTIRQETVKIYRALGVGNRQEAVKKAKAFGLLPKMSSPQHA
jgi:DNA-binding CsgD family transcriptional regulator